VIAALSVRAFSALRLCVSSSLLFNSNSPFA
jgi:hypothetical protein